MTKCDFCPKYDPNTHKYFCTSIAREKDCEKAILVLLMALMSNPARHSIQPRSITKIQIKERKDNDN